MVRQRPEQELPLPFTTRGLQLLQYAKNAVLLRRITVHEVFQHIEAVAVGQHQAIRRLPVTPCAADFLAVVLDGLGQVEVHDIADVTLVDAHAKRDSCDNAIGTPAHETLLDTFAFFMGQPRVISLGLNTVAVQMLGNLLGGFLQGDVDDTRLVGPRFHPLHQPAAFVVAADRFHQQVEVGAIEARGHYIFGSNGELGLHVGDHLGRGRGRQQ